MSLKRFDPWARRRARRLLAQAFYQWQLSGTDIAEVEAQFVDDEGFGRVDQQYFHEVLRGVAGEVDALDTLIAPLLDRPVAQLDQVERALLRMGAYELLRRSEVPWRVVIDECVSLARTFGAEESHKYVNAVLDALARTERAREVAADG
jgi:N utilization substance protein B